MTDQTETATVSDDRSVSAGVTPEGLAGDKVADQQPPSIPPMVGAFRNDKHEYWFNGEGPRPSVTNVLGIIDKPAVGIHKAKEAARAVLHAHYEGHPLGPENEAIAWALKEADKIRDTAAELGSSVHLLADLVAKLPPGGDETAPTGFQLSDLEKPYVAAFNAFLGRYSASSIVSSEHMVWSMDGYAGTYDLLMRLPNKAPCTCGGFDPDNCDQKHELWLIDIKTSGKGPYPEWALQLAGYAWADYIIVPGQSQPHRMPAVDRFGVLHLQPELYASTDGYKLWEYKVTESDYRAFIAALRLYLWRKEGSHRKSQLTEV